MADSLGFVRKVTPSDSTEYATTPFTHVQVGVSGTVTVLSADGVTTTLLSSAILDKVGIVPVGPSIKVMATGTTANDIYIWV